METFKLGCEESCMKDVEAFLCRPVSSCPGIFRLCCRYMLLLMSRFLEE